MEDQNYIFHCRIWEFELKEALKRMDNGRLGDLIIYLLRYGNDEMSRRERHKLAYKVVLQEHIENVG